MLQAMSLQQSADSDNTGSASSVNEDADSADSQTSIAEVGCWFVSIIV
jgi:hypothetical protein